NEGRQLYEVPASIDLSAYDAVTIWCSKFAVPLGSANLNN
ncbi:MAG: DM13 domain-containing protein, partial [Rhizobiaceae bacterium]